MTLLETKTLTIGYEAGKELQRDLNLSLSAGQTVALMGQNGVGKTTFLKTINGLIEPLNGDVLIAGKSLGEHTRAELAKQCALVLTSTPATGNLTARELIALGRHPYSNWIGWLGADDRKIIDQAIELTKTNYIADRRIGELSDGQLQKVMIARALAQDTPLIILDEPVAHLDLNNKIEVMRLLREIANQGKGVLISTHDVQVVNQLADELWLFGFGEQAQKGVPEDLVLNGELEKMLFLEGHNYDLVHHRLEWTAEGPTVQVTGDKTRVFWTQQALARGGYELGTSKIVIECSERHWMIGEAQCQSIGEVLGQLQSITSFPNS